MVRKKITESKENLREAFRDDPAQLGSYTVTTKYRKLNPSLVVVRDKTLLTTLRIISLYGLYKNILSVSGSQ